jgi:hypothetical protein
MFTAVDTDGRESLYSDMIKVGAADPKKIECIPSP